MIETLEDVIEDICNTMGVYGAHDDAECDCSGSWRTWCRVCLSAELSRRIREAAEVESKLRQSSHFERARLSIMGCSFTQEQAADLKQIVDCATSPK